MVYAAYGEIHQFIELVAAEGAVLACSLHLYKSRFATHYNIHIDLRANILFVVEVEPRRPIHKSNTHGSSAALDRRCSDPTCSSKPVESIDRRNTSSSDRGGSGSSVRDKHIAVELDGVFTKLE